MADLRLDSPEAFAAAVLGGRRALRLTQTQLARRAGVGRKFIVHLEAGHARAELSKVLDVLRAIEMIPEVPAAADHPQKRPPVTAYAARRPSAMVDNLSTLTGPAEGAVTLPVTLDWSPKRNYDLNDPDDRRRLYETVISEAMDPDHLQAYLNKDMLVDMWPRLILPDHVVDRWESAFPELAHHSCATTTGRAKPS